MENSPHDHEPAGAERATREAIIEELEYMSQNPTNGDIRIAAFTEAAHAMMINPFDSRLRLLVDFMLEWRRDQNTDMDSAKTNEPFTAQYAVNHLLRSTQHTALFRRNYPILTGDTRRTFLKYPHEFDSPYAWLYELNCILDESNAQDVLDHDLTQRRIQSNVADRYKGPKFVILKEYPDRFLGPLDALDIGASLNLGLTKLCVGDRFDPVEVLSVRESDGEIVVDQKSSNMVNELINRPLQISEGVGIDIMPGWDLNTREWIRSCSFYPSELMDEDKTREFDRLIAANSVLDKDNRQKSEIKASPLNLSALNTYMGDFADRKSMRAFNETAAAKRKFHLVTFITMMHQLTDIERTAMLDRAMRYLRPDGLIIIQDFMRVNPDAPNGLEFPAHWEQFLYRTAVIDPSTGSNQPREVIIWDYGRCRQAILC